MTSAAVPIANPIGAVEVGRAQMQPLLVARRVLLALQVR
jgi:hypothetical protein